MTERGTLEAMIRVVFDGAQYDLPKTGPADLVAFERKFGVSAAAFSEEGGARFEWLCFLVWRGLRRAKVIAAEVEFDDSFLERIEEIDVPDGDDEEADPTVPAPRIV